MSNATTTITEIMTQATPEVRDALIAALAVPSRKLTRIKQALIADPPPNPGQRRILIRELLDLAGYDPDPPK